MKKSDRTYNALIQMALVILYPVLFNLCALIGSADQNRPDSIIKLAGLLVPTGLFILLIIIAAVYKRKRLTTTGSAEPPQRKKYLIILILLAVVSIALRLPMIGTIQRWDTGEYFYTVGTAVRNYDFTIQSFFNEFSIAGHLNHGFSSFIAIPLFFGERNYTLLTIWQVLFSVLAVLALYFILTEAFKFKNIPAALSALMIGNVPIFLGLSVFCTPDYYAVLFFIFALYFDEKRLHILEVFMMLMMCMSKETTTLVVLGYYGVRILFRFFSFKGKMSDRFIGLFKNSDFLVSFSVGVTFVLVMLLKGRSWIESQNEQSKVPIFIGINKPYIIVKFKQYLGSNFAWIFSLLLTFSILVFVIQLIRKKAGKTVTFPYEMKGNLMVSGLFGAMTGFAAFGMLVHIVPHERYNSFFAVAMALLTIVMLNMVIRKTVLITVISGVMAMLLGVESYVTIDPVTKKMFLQLPISEKNTINYESELNSYYGDEFATNYQYAWLDKAFDQMLSDIDYDKDKGRFFPDIEADGGSGLQFFGNSKYYRIDWDSEQKKRIYYNKEDRNESEVSHLSPVERDKVMLPYKNNFTNIMEADGLPDLGYMCFVPYFSRNFVSEYAYLGGLSPYYYYLDKCKSQKYRGEIVYYPLIKKDSSVEDVSLDMIKQVEEESGEDLKSQDAPDDKKNDGIEMPDDLIVSDGNDTFLTERIDERYKHRRASHMLLDELNYDQKTNIEPRDSVYVTISLRDKQGNPVPLSYSGEESRVTVVGEGEIIEEFDKALLEMNAFETRDVDFVVPENYPELEDYAGQTLTATLETGEIALTVKYKTSYRSRKTEYNQAVKDIFAYYRREDMKSILRSSVVKYHQELEQNPELKIDTEDIDKYFEGYFERMNISEEEYLEKCLKTDKEHFEEYKKIAAFSSENVKKYSEEYDRLMKEYLGRY